MRNKRAVGAVIALLAVLLGCFFMPDYVAGIIDRNTMDTLTILDTKSISFEARPDLTIQERLTLIAGSDHESILLKNGKLSESEAREQIISELKRFFGSSGLIGDTTVRAVNECMPMFFIDAETTVNLIAWGASLSFMSGEDATIIFDEETGVLLQIILYRYSWQNAIIRPGGIPRDPLKEDAEVLRELIGEYYGMPVAPLKYELIDGLGFYTVEMDFEGVSIALYGIVRDSRVTVNE